MAQVDRDRRLGIGVYFKDEISSRIAGVRSGIQGAVEHLDPLQANDFTEGAKTFLESAETSLVSPESHSRPTFSEQVLADLDSIFMTHKVVLRERGNEGYRTGFTSAYGALRLAFGGGPVNATESFDDLQNPNDEQVVEGEVVRQCGPVTTPLLSNPSSL